MPPVDAQRLRCHSRGCFFGARLATLSLLTTYLLIAAPPAVKPTLVVAPLQSAKKDKENADTLGEMIRIQVGSSDRYALVTPEDIGVMEDLILAAFNDAKSKVEAKTQEKMSELTGGISLPEGFKLPF